jgi:hypothetical protein
MTTNAVERSTYVLPVGFLDADGETVVPSVANWTLYGHDKETVINGRQDVPLVGNYITLTGDDLALPNSSQSSRYVLIKATYDSATFGNNLSFRAEIQFKVVNLGTIEPGT